MVKENIRQEFRLKKIDETRNYLLEKIKQNELMSRKHKKILPTLNYTEHFLILAYATTEYISISGFASLLGILREITGFAIGLKNFTIATKIKEYKSIIKKKIEAQ